MVQECVLPDYSQVPEEAFEIVKATKSLAIIGASPKKERPSHQVFAYLLKQEFKVVPVNPGQTEILGQKCYPSLLDIPFSIDTAVIFRKPEAVKEIIYQALQKGVSNIWMQEGIISQDAYNLAKEKGLNVIMNFCFKKVHILLKTK
ncbi:CoA-binding protein [Desulfonauticus submarinus]